MVIRTQFLFSHGAAGWSETYFTNHETPLAANQALRTLAQRRIRLCGVGPDLVAIRSSKEGVKGDSYLFHSNYRTIAPGGSELLGTAFVVNFGNADVLGTALTAVITAAGVDRGLIFLRGLPDPFFTGLKNWHPDAAWTAAWNLYKNEFINRGCGLLFNPPPLDTDYVVPDGVVGGTQTLPIHVLKLGHGLATGDQIWIGRVKTNVGPFSGLYRVDLVDANEFTLRGTVGLAFLTTEEGHYRKITRSFTPAQLLVQGTVTQRKVGRPFGSPVGRRKRILSSR